jgi:phosphoglycolate phosphatase
LKTRIFQKIKEELQNSKAHGLRPCIAGINGVDASGKTSFTQELNEFLLDSGLKTLCIYLDDFHNEAEKRMSRNDEIHAYIKTAFNLELLERAILKPLYDESYVSAELTLLDLDKNDYTVTKNFQASADTIILLEGSLLFREPVDKYLGYRIFLDVSFDEVKRRAEIRDVPRFGAGIIKKYEKKYIPIQEQYISEKKPKEKADMVIKNDDFENPEIVFHKVNAHKHRPALRGKGYICGTAGHQSKK